MTGGLHIAAALAALLAGLAVFARRKGGRQHRWLGRTYVALMLAVNFSALATYDETGGVGTFHVLAVFSLATVVAGLAFAVARRPAGAWRPVHAYLMAWSWVGLFAAGASQLATMAAPGRPGLTVGGTTALVCALAAGIIHRRVPRILAARPWLAEGAKGRS